MRALKTNLHLTVRKIFIGEGGSTHPSPSHPLNDLRLPRACPHSPHIPQNSCWKWVCVTGPLGAPSRGWRPSRASPFSHGQLLRSRRVSEGKTWTWNDPTKQSPWWVHPQATAPVPLTPKLSCSSLFLDLFFQLDQYIFQRSITPSPPIPSCFPYSLLPPTATSHLVNSSYFSHKTGKAFQVYSFRCFLLFTPATLMCWECGVYWALIM